MKMFLCIIVCLVVCSTAGAQKIERLSKKKGLSLRGLSVVDDQTFWATGSKGIVAVSTNGGKEILWRNIPGYEDRDFRDVEAFDNKTAIIMAIGNPAVILKTTDAGASWRKVYEQNLTGMFLDAMCFEDNSHGICIGDPINDRFYIIETMDGGETWEEMPFLMRPLANPGEALFASSGTNVQPMYGSNPVPKNFDFSINTNPYSWAFISGGKVSRFFLIGTDVSIVTTATTLSMKQGEESTGANSLAVDSNRMFIAGGDFKKPAEDQGNHAISNDAGKTWQYDANGLQGYKSCVIFANDSSLIACGTSGVAISNGGMQAWKTITKSPYHVVQKAKKGSTIYFAGPKGSIGKLKK